MISSVAGMFSSQAGDHDDRGQFPGLGKPQASSRSHQEVAACAVKSSRGTGIRMVTPLRKGQPWGGPGHQ